ncbi:conserved hypothetical protein [Streptomyces viridochromogenes DSM 40736]|uniref:Restriction endonuclease type IV Mrr domain-containing protein n=1 Tax=Streptomyces viridochromogenes (strain DSM 40736 / JCM 4977 / BCRC 1201 / Tue 494) TaxID=591159 RepID=D9X2Y3_STRVT|nr:conserved hypothetical protein [Streptomyces viridochromogenes DSM 40736]
MAETVPVRCPACHREHRYTAPAYPCACGAPVAPRLDRHGVATPVSHRVWQDDWVTVHCRSCGRGGDWPRPEVGCSCGVVMRVPVMDAQDVTDQADATGQDTTPDPNPDPENGTGRRATAAAPDTPAAQPPFHSVTIRTALDAVTTTALYLRWLGYRGVRRADQRPPSGIGLAARGVVAQVDPAVRPATLRDVECLWLTAMTESADCLYFSLTGYTADARARADTLGIPLFVLDLTGTPRPVNEPAGALAGTENRAP